MQGQQMRVQMECLVHGMLQVQNAQLLKLLLQAHVALYCHIQMEQLDMLPQLMKVLAPPQLLLQVRD